MSFRLAVLAALILTGCAALRPDAEPLAEPTQEAAESQVVTATVDPGEDAVVLLREEFTALKRENQQLREEFAEVQDTLKRRDEEFLRLQTQWETNFALMERSVADTLAQQEQALAEVKNRPASTPAQNTVAAKPVEPEPPKPEPEPEPGPEPAEPEEKAPAQAASAITTYSLIGTTPKPSEEINEDDLKDSDDLQDTEPAAARSGDDPLPGLPLTETSTASSAPSSSTSVTTAAAVNTDAPSRATSTVAAVAAPKKQQPGFHDPDLEPPETPQLLRRRPGVKKLYNQGMDALIKQNYDEAIRMFENLVIQFPDDLDADNAQHWVGHAHFKLRQLEDAELAFRKVLRNYEHRPTSQGYKTPEAILMLGRVMMLRKQTEQAHYYWEEVTQRYPDSSAAREAKKDLAKLGDQ